MKGLNMKLNDAYFFVKRKRLQICPNNGFARQLITSEGTLFGGVVTLDIIHFQDDWGFGFFEYYREILDTHNSRGSDRIYDDDLIK